MKKIFKIVGITIISIVMIYATFLYIEGKRFLNNPGAKPLVVLKIDSNIDASDKGNRYNEVYTSLGFTVKYDYVKSIRSSSDNILYDPIKGEGKLFNKYLIWAWIA